MILTEHADVTGKWYFALQPHQGVPAGELLGFEIKIEREDDPCEVYCSAYKPVDGRLLPHRLEVRHGNNPYVVFTVKNYKVAKLKLSLPPAACHPGSTESLAHGRLCRENEIAFPTLSVAALLLLAAPGPLPGRRSARW